jgi:hypothetical protein
MRIRNMLGLATIGGLLYLHRKRGGDWTIDSFRDTAKKLWSGVQTSAESAKQQLREASDKLQSATHEQRGEAKGQGTGYGTGSGGGDRYSR